MRKCPEVEREQTYRSQEGGRCGAAAVETTDLCWAHKASPQNGMMTNKVKLWGIAKGPCLCLAHQRNCKLLGDKVLVSSSLYLCTFSLPT